MNNFWNVTNQKSTYGQSFNFRNNSNNLNSQFSQKVNQPVPKHIFDLWLTQREQFRFYIPAPKKNPFRQRQWNNNWVNIDSPSELQEMKALSSNISLFDYYKQLWENQMKARFPFNPTNDFQHQFSHQFRLFWLSKFIGKRKDGFNIFVNVQHYNFPKQDPFFYRNRSLF